MDSCETHDWWEGLVEAELARLRAEGTECVQHKEYKLVWCAQCIKTEREVAQHYQDEALAQVAVLIIALEDALSDIHYNHGCDPRCEEKRHVLASPLTEARALLDRLQRAEAVVEAFKKEADEIMNEKGSYDVVVDAGVQREYERAYAFIQRLAALRGDETE